ncbi:hypothetical protein R1flu_015760 [Riccia fluitans]|uniref:DUF676 domain-containing protein n=1 Tax=Riccia fluitans TaxID=41844 RepID=A0ABD1YN16_9MARC
MSSNLTRESQHQKFEGRRVNDYVYQLCPDRNENTVQPADVDIILFHGLQMPGREHPEAYWRTWKMRKSEDFWPEKLLPQLLNEGVQPGGKTLRARVLAICYEGRLDQGYEARRAARGAKVEEAGVTDDYLLVEDLIENLIFDDGVNAGQNVPVFLLGHDLGGILIKLFVIGVENKEATMNDDKASKREKLRNFLGNLRSVHFFATPHSGMPIMDKVVESIESKPGTPQHEMLHYLKVLNNKKARVNQAFQLLRDQTRDNLRISRFTTRAFLAGSNTDMGKFGNVQAVVEGTARLGIDEFYTYSRADHFQVCQPEGTHSSPFRILAREIRNAPSTSSSEQPANREEVREKRREFLDNLENLVYVTSSTEGSSSSSGIRNRLRG